MGLGDAIIEQTVPTQVGTATNWASVSGGEYHTLAVKADGTLWAWGNNGAGQLGTGNTTDQTAPVQVGTATNWASVSAGGNHTLAIKTDGTLWAWGRNDGGQLGIGNTTNQNAPVQVSAGVVSTVSVVSSQTTAVAVCAPDCGVSTNMQWGN
ncbi:MAG: hypothetical protein IPN94_23540 [Sphingobacteriales bacterium]|nr:hypothetical protein [Sphingobacteriales bacterium]